jgi:hypothetical protein
MTDQRRHEAPEVGAMIGRMLNALIRRAAEGDTEAIEQLQHVEQLATQAFSAGLAEARSAAGYSNGELAAVIGASRQNVSQRVSRATPAPCGHLGCVGMKRCRVA